MGEELEFPSAQETALVPNTDAVNPCYVLPVGIWLFLLWKLGSSCYPQEVVFPSSSSPV